MLLDKQNWKACTAIALCLTKSQKKWLYEAIREPGCSAKGKLNVFKQNIKKPGMQTQKVAMDE